MFNLFAMTAEAAQPSGLGSLLQLIIPLALMFGLMYFLMIRPQKKKEKALRDLINSMSVGDKCQTTGGIVGKVVNIKDDEVTIQTSVANTLITLKKAAITSVVKPYSDDN
ncbi:MAG: preprotein translocase subunit YajC [Eubacteriales bacterium]|jgi:preprotein translocase subunit YajC|nr:preprotein translocase subunit YajC [Eubacteriales bacterium]MDD4326974.1 preprotein translocase subunit YajC [Eubacteriales bacterium]MDD4717691.1 preprotein translocase subunit YajC [Eubacteriales bacterium]